jgi:hypothetical protein
MFTFPYPRVVLTSSSSAMLLGCYLTTRIALTAVLGRVEGLETIEVLEELSGARATRR